ncbi:magnesium transporter MRS2-7-like isoform X2 [Phaseolus vulgaris]|uniref:magnesium transporter MRS2-7-like isoform X2 n=1 Tax=Phaseolus vulgaris TaxID=3885 RepID=UPI0035C9B55F
MLGRGSRQTPAPRPRILDTETEVGQPWTLLDWEGKVKELEVRYDAINRHIGLSANDLDNSFSSRSIILSLREASVSIGRTSRLSSLTQQSSSTQVTPPSALWSMSCKPGSSGHSLFPTRTLSTRDPLLLTPTRHFAPLEFTILKFFLKTICSKFDDEVKTIEEEAHSLLDQSIFQRCTLGICDPKMEVIEKIKYQLRNLTARIQKMSDELEQLKDDDNRKTMMCLTEMLEQQISPADSFRTAPQDIDLGEPSDIEILLDNYLRKNIETSKKVSRYVDESQSLIKDKEDRRNSNIIKMTLVVSIGSLGLSLFRYFHSK